MSVTRFVLVFLFAARCLFAQISTSTIRGNVSDPTGAAVPSAAISLIDVNTNQTWSVTSNGSGDFEIPELLHDTYRLTATAPGFKTFVADNIILAVEETRRVDVHFELGTASTKVTVNASAAVIATDSAKITGDFTRQTIDDAPLIGDARNQTLLLTTLPQIQQSSNSIYAVEMAGQSGNQLQEQMDGFATGDGAVNQMAGIDITQEVNAVTVNNTAEFARVGAYNATTKSGSNVWHGQAYWWVENSALNAKDVFAAFKPKSKVDTLHADISGPIFKNKTFFYASWWGQRWPGGSSNLTTTPTALMQTGDFSQLLGLATPKVIYDPTTGLPFSGNKIPLARQSAVTLATQSGFVPLPNIGAPGQLAANYFFAWPWPGDLRSGNLEDGRIDHQFSDKNRFFGKYAFYGPAGVNYALAGSYPNLGWTRYRAGRDLVIEDTEIFTPTLVNTARFGLYWNTYDDGVQVSSLVPKTGAAVVAQIGLQGVNPNNYKAEGFPDMAIAGYPTLSSPPGGGGNGQDYKNFGYADSLTWSKGRHVVKFGGELRKFSQYSHYVPDSTYGNFNFDGTLTALPTVANSGYGYADFLLGLPHTTAFNPNPLLGQTQLDSELGLFVQDSFKVNSKLTLDLGLRWDKFGSASYDTDKIYRWDIATDDIIVPSSQLSNVSPLYPSNITVASGQVQDHPSRKNFAPRIGFAYRLNDKTVFRGGFGIFTEALGEFAFAQTGGPYAVFPTYFNTVTGGVPLFSMPNPFPPAGTAGHISAQSASGYPLNADNGRIYQYSATIERQVKDIGFRLSYLGSQGRGLNYGISVDKPQPSLIPFNAANNPYPNFVSASYERNNGETKYNALTFEAKRKVGQVTFDAFWTYASNLSNENDLENPYAPLGFSNDPYTSRHRVVINAVWNIPVGNGRQYLSNMHGVGNQVLGGWQLYLITYLETGQWFSPSYSGSDPSNTNVFGGLPNRICNGNLSSGSRSTSHWFDTSCFTTPLPGTFGNAAPNSLESPGLNSEDLTIQKTFFATERLHVTFAGSFENLFNHPNFWIPASNVSVPTAGVITSDRSYIGPRTVMLRLRVQF